MKSLNRKLFKKFAVFSGIAGVSSLIALPGIAELNQQVRGFKKAGDRVLELAQNSPTSPSSPNAPNTPANNNNPGRSPNTPNAPANNNPGRSPNTPNAPANNNNPGGTTNTPTGENSTNSLSARDRNFVLQAAQNGMLEVELGRLAVQRGSSAAIKQHGQQMVQEHSQANQELMQLATQKGMEVSREMNAQNQALRQRLAGLSGATFDTAYQQAMRDSHSRAIALFQAQSQQGQDPELKAWATQLLPDLQAHLQMVNQLSQNPQQNTPPNTRQQ
ncbi:MAG: DUF4142 domain-containing protein [Oscillatoriaceae cyanobacterium Prado104]|nr:DUF4142 domain-containing protein [Oscillatoriaceae cyanobacterium Prado104]